MASLSTWLRYATNKLQYSLALSWKNYNIGQINGRELSSVILQNLFQGKLTFMHSVKGEEMSPTISGNAGTLLVRKLPLPTTSQVFVGDVVLLKDPENPNDYIVRRLAAMQGYEMISSDEKDEPFILDYDECWVLADNTSLKAKEARDSRLFGPVHTAHIIGRVVYALQTSVDHGPVENSPFAMNQDSAILAVELDVEEMMKNNGP